MKSRWTVPVAGTVAILLLTLLVYFPALRGGFIWDDDNLIIHNPMVKAGDGLYRFWFTTEPVDYWPLTSSLWWLEWRLWGQQAFGYHAANVLLHAADAVLIWILLQRLAVRGAWLAALVFAVHPVNVATAAWISEHKNTLSMLFYAAAILLYLKFDRENRWRWYGLSLTAFLLSLLSKAAVVVLPIVLLLCLWWLHGRLRRRDWLSSVPYFILSLALGLVTMWFQYHRVAGGHATRTEDFRSQLAAAGWVPWFYLYKLLLPIRLTVIYPRWDVNGSQWISFLPGAALTGCLAWLWWRRATWWGRPLFFGLAYFVVTLFPVMGFFQQGFFPYSLVADHWQYYSSIGVIALVVAAGVELCRRTGHWRRWGIITASSVLAVLGVAAFQRCEVYAADETLWRDTIAKNPSCSMPYFNLGNDLVRLGKVPEAISQYEQAVGIKPDYVKAHNNLGNVLAQLGRLQEAIGHFERALRFKPDYAEAHNNLGLALAQQGRWQEAIEHYEQALRIKPETADAHYNLGLALEKLGKVQEAISHFDQALRINPDDAEAHYNLGVAYIRLGRVQEATGHWEQTVRLQPDHVEAQFNLGLALERMGRTTEAVEHYQRALKLRPYFTAVSNALARARAVQ